MEEESKKIEIKLLQEKYPEAPTRFLEEFLNFAWVTDSADAFLLKQTTAFYTKRSIAKMILWRIPPGKEKLKAIATKREVPRSIEHSANVDPEILGFISCLARQKMIKDKIERLEDLDYEEKLDRQKEEFLQKLKDEEQAISDWLDYKQEPRYPTTWDADVLKKFPSEYLDEIKKDFKPQATTQESPADSGQETDHGVKSKQVYQQLTNQIEETSENPQESSEQRNVPVCDPDVIGKEKIKFACGYDPKKKNWTVIERHCNKLDIKIRHVDDNIHLDPKLKKSECNQICARKLAIDRRKIDREKRKNKKLVAEKK